jgi:hypothetical protein
MYLVEMMKSPREQKVGLEKALELLISKSVGCVE